jgi:hypothetical protein
MKMVADEIMDDAQCAFCFVTDLYRKRLELS